MALVTLEFSRGRLAQVTQNRLCKGETQYFEVRAESPSASYRASFGGRARSTTGLLRDTKPHIRFEYGLRELHGESAVIHERCWPAIRKTPG